LYIHEGKCVTECPEGMVVNEDKTACRKRQLTDL